MDEFDFIEPKPRRRWRFGAAFLNLLSLVLLAATICIGGYYALLFFNPQSEFNPFPPATPTQAEIAAEASPIAEETAEESSAVVTEEPTATESVEPSATAEVPTATATVAPTREPGSYYEIQPGSPVALDSSIFHPDLGCNFLGVAGQAFGLEDAPIPGLIVRVSGTLNGESVDKAGLTGAASQYGAGSYYEVLLGDEPIASENSLSIQILDGEGVPASDPFSFSTFASCEQNLILVNFKALP